MLKLRGPFLAGIFLTAVFTSCSEKNEISEYEKETAEETKEKVKEAFAGESTETAEGQHEEIEQFFVALGEASRSGKRLRAEDFLSMDAINQALESSGALDGINSKDKKDFKEGIKIGLNNNFTTNMQQMAYDQSKVMRVEKIDDDEVLVYMRHYDADIDVNTKMRWWLVNTEDGWRYYDYEDLDMGLRTVELMGLIASAMMKSTPDPWVEDFIPVVNKLQTIDLANAESYSEMREGLEKLRKHNLPKSIKRFASGMMVTVMQTSGESEAAIAELKAAKEGGYQTPLYHYQMGGCLMGMEKYEEAAERFTKYAEEYGWDSDVSYMYGECLLELERYAQAREVVEKELKNNPGNLNLLAILFATSSPGEITENAVKHIGTTADELWAYEVCLDYLIAFEMKDKAEALYEIFKNEHPDSDLHEYYPDALKEIGTTVEPATE